MQNESLTGLSPVNATRVNALRRMRRCLPGIDEGIRGSLHELVGDDGGHAVRLCIVVGRGQNIAGTLGRACAQAGQRAPNEPKPAVSTQIASDIQTEHCSACCSRLYCRNQATMLVMRSGLSQQNAIAKPRHLQRLPILAVKAVGVPAAIVHAHPCKNTPCLSPPPPADVRSPFPRSCSI